MMYTAAQIAQACEVPLVNAQANWPLLLAALAEQGIVNPAGVVLANVAIAVAANVAEETNHTFLPIEEYGDQAYFQAELGADWWYHGRGFDQETWRSTYAHAGQVLGLDLVNHPELLLNAKNSARATALFVKEKPGFIEACQRADWVEARRLWNGGSNGLDYVLRYTRQLVALPYPPDVPPLAGREFHVVTKCGLKSQPNHTCGLAVDHNRHPVVLPVGAVVIATGDQTPHWYHVRLPVSPPVPGWVLQENVRA